MILLFVEERQNAPSDLDSLTAQQLDEKFKEIMMKKRGTSVYIYTDIEVSSRIIYTCTVVLPSLKK